MTGEISPPGQAGPPTAGASSSIEPTRQTSSCVNQALNLGAKRREPESGSLRRLGFLKADSKTY